MVITIDGPAASGKSTVSHLLAQRLNCFYLATGMLYRGLAYLLITKYDYTQAHLRQPNPHDVFEILSALDYTVDAQKNSILSAYQTILTPYLHEESIGHAASLIAPHQFIREQLCIKERALVGTASAVVEGRDAGTVVFPTAEHKIFLYASPHVRAQRIYADQQRGKVCSSLSDIEASLQERDERDTKRAHGALQQAAGSWVFDTSPYTIAQVVDMILQRVQCS